MRRSSICRAITLLFGNTWSSSALANPGELCPSSSLPIVERPDRLQEKAGKYWA